VKSTASRRPNGTQNTRPGQRFTEAQGAGGHCEGLGATLFEEYVFDWLDDVLARSSK
jgi:hypothetical protein